MMKKLKCELNIVFLIFPHHPSNMAVPHKYGMSIDEFEWEGLHLAREFLGRSKDFLEKKVGP